MATPPPLTAWLIEAPRATPRDNADSNASRLSHKDSVRRSRVRTHGPLGKRSRGDSSTASCCPGHASSASPSFGGHLRHHAARLTRRQRCPMPFEIPGEAAPIGRCHRSLTNDGALLVRTAVRLRFMRRRHPRIASRRAFDVQSMVSATRLMLHRRSARRRKTLASLVPRRGLSNELRQHLALGLDEPFTWSSRSTRSQETAPASVSPRGAEMHRTCSRQSFQRARGSALSACREIDTGIQGAAQS